MTCNAMLTGISHRPFGNEQCFHLKGQAAFFSDCWILNTEATRSTAKSANICRSTRHNIPETLILYSFLLPIKKKHNITMWKWVKLCKILRVPGNPKSFIYKEMEKESAVMQPWASIIHWLKPGTDVLMQFKIEQTNEVHRCCSINLH